MLVLLISWLILTIVFLAYGNMLISLWNTLAKQTERYSIFDTFWIGLGTVSALSCIISLFAPLNIYILGIILSLSILYFIVNFRLLTNLLKTIKHVFINLSNLGRLCICLIILVCTLFSLRQLNLYDFGLYHEQTMLWVENYSVVPGLGNIQGRFAFNSNLLLLDTLLSYHPTFYMTFFPINGLIFCMFFLWILNKLISNGNICQKIIVLFIPILFLFMFRNIISSSSTDVIPAIIVLYLLINCATCKDSLNRQSLLFIIVSLTCITFKLSTIPIILITIPILFETIKHKKWRVLASIILLGSIIIIPWCVRFIILSGYLIYPYPAIDIFSFDWKIPIEEVIYEKDSIRAWAILPDPSISKKVLLSTPFIQWVPMWWKDLNLFYKMAYLLALISPIWLLSGIKKIKNNSHLIFAYIVGLLGSIIGFLSAPDLRFAYGFVLFIGIFPICIFLSSIKGKSIKVFFVFTIICSLTISAFIISSLYKTWDSEESRTALFIKPQPINRNTLYDYVGNNIMEEFTTREKGGFFMNYPIFDERCYNFCLPCTTRYYMDEPVEQRGETFQSGFRIKK